MSDIDIVREYIWCNNTINDLDLPFFPQITSKNDFVLMSNSTKVLFRSDNISDIKKYLVDYISKVKNEHK
jgi:hypothetical protein